MKTIQCEVHEWPEAMTWLDDPKTRQRLSELDLGQVTVNEQAFAITMRSIDEIIERIYSSCEGLDAILDKANKPKKKQKDKD